MEMENDIQDLSREERREQIRQKKRRKIKRIALIAAAVVFVVILAVLIAGAVKRHKDASFSQIGPFPPSDSEELIAVKQVYDYSKPVPEADESSVLYFESALFIGDVRVEGMTTYIPDLGGTLIYGQSMTTQTAATDTFRTSTGTESTVIAASIGKDPIYIMLGLNETGWSYPELYETYLDELVKSIKAACPESSVYICSIIPLTESVAASRSYLTLDLIRNMNNMAQKVAASQRVYYLDVAEKLAPKGWLESEFAEANGLSLSANGYQALREYLVTHTVDKELYS